MEREGFKLPLLIGGATTSRMHTAVKIAPNYSGPTVYVPDASRAVSVVSSLLGDGNGEFAAQVRADYDATRQQRAAQRRDIRRATLAEARANKCQLDWQAYTPPAPAFLGIKVFDDYDLEDLSRYIDWTPFFKSWDLAGAYPRILEDKTVGEAARALFADAREMLKQIIEEGWLTAPTMMTLWSTLTRLAVRS
jgi:5-methyltetrahydrofolate--homocysteine methyltransferase